MIASTGASRIDKKDLTNDASTVLRLTMEEVSCLILGDLDQLGESILIENIPAEYLQVDLIQVAHHTWNQILRLYDIARAEYAVFTQSEGGSNRTLGINARAVLRKIQQYAKPEHCYFSSVETSGLLFRNGTVTLKETFPLCYNSFDFPWKYAYEGVDMSTVKDYKDEEP